MTSSTSDSKPPTARPASFAAGALYLCCVAAILLSTLLAENTGQAASFRFDGSSDDTAVQLTIGHRFSEMFEAKIGHLLSAPPYDVLSIGNHLMGGFRPPADWRGSTSFNAATTGISNDGLRQVVQVLEAHGRLPKKLLLVTMLPHYPHINGRAYDIPFSLDRGEQLAWWDRLRATVKRLSTNLTYQVSYVAALDAMVGATGRIMTIDLARCAERFRTSADIFTGLERLRLKTTAYLPTEFLLGAGIIDVDLMCREKNLFHLIDMNSVRGDGSHPYSTPLTVSWHSPYSVPAMDEATVRKEAELSATSLRQVADIGARGGAQVVFLVPPRLELPLDGDNDRVLNLAFALAPELVVIDHRRLSLDTSLTVDGSHPNDTYVARHLSPCLRRILGGEPLVEFPAVDNKGRTAC